MAWDFGRKSVMPDAGQDYLVLSGEANTVLSGLITRMGLGTLFEAEDTDSKITINLTRWIDTSEDIQASERC